MIVKSIYQWTEPDGKTVHEPGEIADVMVPDLDVLFAIGTVEKVVEDDPSPTLVLSTSAKRKQTVTSAVEEGSETK